MRTSLNNIKTIEDYCFGRMANGDALLFEANVLLNKKLAEDVTQQGITYEVIKKYSRKKIREEIMAVKNKLVAVPEHQGFMQRIINLFKKY